jgi:two-component system, OmpR family, response regulator CpxR
LSVADDHRILQMAGGGETATRLKHFLTEQGLSVSAPANERECIRLATGGAYDLILLDHALPHLDGFDVLGVIRTRCEIPVIMLTRALPGERVKALELGADDCMSVPPNFPELLARIRAVLRRNRGNTHAPRAIQIRSIRIDPGSRDVWAGDRRVELTATEYVILESLMQAAGRVVTRERLNWVLRQREPSALDRSLDVHVAHLRRKIGRGSAIRTVRGEGYFFRKEPLEGAGELRS